MFSAQKLATGAQQADATAVDAPVSASAMLKI
jgi:3-hydroxyisobutyrate dehydrogenase-like beta-hydroxyacid dehydrogenase